MSAREQAEEVIIEAVRSGWPELNYVAQKVIDSIANLPENVRAEIAGFELVTQEERERRLRTRRSGESVVFYAPKDKP